MLLRWTPKHLIPNIDHTVMERCDKNGYYQVEPPTPKEGKLVVVGVPSQDMTQFSCNSLYVKKPDTVCKCNSVVTTLVGQPTGDHTQIIECGKCRTSYIMRTVNGKTTIKVWDISRNLKNFVEPFVADKKHYVVKFNTDKK